MRVDSQIHVCHFLGALVLGLGQIFLDEYTANRQIQNEEAIANDIVATLVVEFMRDRETWYGLYSELYKKLEGMAEDYAINSKSKKFPENAIVLSKRLTNVKSNLEAVGIMFVRDESKSRTGQHLTISKSSSPYAPSAQSYAPPKASNNATCADGDDSADKILTLGDWATITNEELPEGF